jgi:hypothetical protein
MSRTRKLIIAFWIFIGIMLLWQFYNYDQGLTRAAVEHPTQEHFWFTNSASATPVASSQAHRNGADVQQTAFSVQNNTPSAGNFTCRVTLKNMGNAKAVGVQVSVRPFRGISLGDADNGHGTSGVLSDSDPISQIGQWVTFPDLAPGESGTESAVFLNRNDMQPGTNPNPEIIFQTQKIQ